ncbi:urea ABC transporter permease subunit UrtB [Synoicihabitans lomoniglobus]|uniref:Urea ABC transporter permease subunit UrtB n=1 Tax=Synoicihabitans lomoniglobus TaxID=2909285 RepID=A0AAF0CNV2_9BACT|nr:urea ABC transporter permease subunit UrtB [Opitutaceae bacterium LMO-M01]WED64895.1 urea ABC transporter permease subunit UrtB [Opitutaceae bacterium LMO-M01]
MKFIHIIPRLLIYAGAVLAFQPLSAQSAKETVIEAMLAANDREKREIIGELAGDGDPVIAELFDAWKADELFIYTTSEGDRVPVRVPGGRDAFETAEPYSLLTDAPLVDAAGAAVMPTRDNLDRVRHNNRLRRAMKEVLDLIDLGSPDPAKRLQAVQTIGFSRDLEKLPILQKRLTVEKDSNVHQATRQSIALLQLSQDDLAVKIAAVKEMEAIHSLSGYDALLAVQSEAQQAKQPELVAAATKALAAIDRHRSVVDFVGTIFRGLSLGSILLVVALGLAITFGLMGVINMAHGEMIAVGAYTTYLVQNVFGAGVVIPAFGLSVSIPGMNLEGWAYSLYFIAAIPLSFIMAALVGIALERGIIQFLYRRPLESLLATWGVSLVLQQVFRLMFGANNVQVSSPAYLSGNWTVADIVFGWNRVFVIGFAVLIVFGVWLALNKTSLGLLIRAVMQNRGMASHMGVRTTRVNMLTFGLGSGLAGLAGAFLSQIGNVGPSLGQSYIVDSFMVVVVGGVGNILGTVISAFGIGGIDQVLQQYLPAWAPGLGWVPLFGSFLQNLAQDSSVFGKILVLAFIILFLQWRPAGIFATRGRQLED